MDDLVDPLKRYRLVGICADGPRQVLAIGLNAVEVMDTFMEYFESHEYDDLVVEDDRPATGA